MSSTVCKKTSIIFGNRCCHDPKHLRAYKRKVGQKEPPLLITKTCERLRHYFKKPLKYLRNLRAAWINFRQTRSERRECEAVIMQVMVNHMDLESFKVGHHVNGELLGMTIKTLAKKSTFGIRRVQRAMRNLERAGYLHVERHTVKTPKGDYKQICDITIDESFFLHLGIKKEHIETTKHYKRKSATGAVPQQNHVKKATKRAKELIDSVRKVPVDKLKTHEEIIADVHPSLRNQVDGILSRSKNLAPS